MLPIFPEGGLTSSVITTVWVGVFVLAFFNLRFGWVLSGLVVPGYLVPLLILRPVAAGVIVFEAVLTYLIVYWFSERIARGRFNALFGRDRFMGMVLVSIAIRALFDGWLLPEAADWLAAHTGARIDWHSNLQSFGLVVISLMANQLWKPGLLRGLFAAFVTIGLTWLIVRFGLMEFTNFRLSGVSYVYEGLASSILASPKAYIILVLTAFIASQMNVRYGWDFSGILIPALIALQWYQPTKVLTSFVEAAVIYFLAIAVMKLPIFANVTIEGARKLVLFFNVSFAYKMALGHLLNLLELDVKTTDFYGFGYLLSTLIAIKAFDKDIFPRVMRSTLEVSVAGALAGNLVGFILTLLLPAGPGGTALAAERRQADDVGTLLAAAVGDAHMRRAGLSGPPPDPEADRNLGDVIELLDSGVSSELFIAGMVTGDLHVTRHEGGILAIARREGAGRELLLFDPAATGSLALVVPDAAARPGIAAAGLALFGQQRARWLVLAAAGDEESQGGVLAALRSRTRAPELVLEPDGQSGARLALAGNSSASLDLGQLRQLYPGLVLSFDRNDAANRARLALGAAEIARLAGIEASVAAPAPQGDGPSCSPRAFPDEQTARPDLARLAFLRFEIAEPLLDGLAAKQPLPEVARRNAQLAGWNLGACLLGGRPRWLLELPGGAAGTYLFDPAGDRSRLLATEAGKSRLLTAGLDLAQRWQAGALLIAPRESVLVGRQQTPFGVISQAVLRRQEARVTRLVQVRIPHERVLLPDPASDAAVVPDLLESNHEWSTAVADLARSAGLKPIVVKGERPTAGLEIAPNRALRYFSQTSRGRHATIWLLGEPTMVARPSGTGG